MALKSARAGQTFAHQWWTTNCVSILVFFACSFFLCCCISHWFSHLIFCLNVFFSLFIHQSIHSKHSRGVMRTSIDWGEVRVFSAGWSGQNLRKQFASISIGGLYRGFCLNCNRKIWKLCHPKKKKKGAGIQNLNSKLQLREKCLRVKNVTLFEVWKTDIIQSGALFSRFSFANFINTKRSLDFTDELLHSAQLGLNRCLNAKWWV